MSTSIQAGDTAVVITGLGRHKSPNIGLSVKVASLQGNHSKFGVVWRCTGAGIKQLSDSGTYEVTGWADFPATWLKKVDPKPATTLADTALEAQS